MSKPKLAVYKFASCDGCQLSLLDAEEVLLAVAEAVHIAFFPEASREYVDGPYDITFVEGSITTPHDLEMIQKIRENTGVLVAIGSCATAGGIQALRNWKDVKEFTSYVYAHPEYISTLDKSTPISDHVKVDFELRGCPLNKWQLVELVNALLHDRKPILPTYSVCVECKRRGTTCVMVAQDIPCLGPVTHAGCNALCPAYNRGCFGCYGPMESPNMPALTEWWKSLGVDDRTLVNALRSYNAYAQPFREASDVYAQQA